MNCSTLRNAIALLLVPLVLSCGGGGSGGASAAGDSGNLVFAGNFAPGDGGDGLGGIAADDGSSSSAAASGGDDGSGVGSGGTGVSADASGVGSVDGAGSIIVNGLRYDTTSTVGLIEDAAGLQLGMSAKVVGPVNADFTRGVALRVESAADLRGPLSSVSLAQGSFVILGTTVTTDEATVWADVPGLASIPPGTTLQVWGLPAEPGALRATRIEQRDPAALILTGTVQNLDPTARTFTLGGLVVDYAAAVLDGNPGGQPLANGTIVRVRANGLSAGRLAATRVQWWYPVPRTEGVTLQLAGIVTNYAGLSSLRVLGIEVDASSVQVTGGPAGAIGNGVKVEVGGTLGNGTLRATKLKIRHVPGTGGPASFDLTGTVGAFESASSFRVRGQPVNAGGAGVVFANGTSSALRNGTKVRVRGSQVVNGVLMADSVVFE